MFGQAMLVRKVTGLERALFPPNSDFIIMVMLVADAGFACPIRRCCWRPSGWAVISAVRAWTGVD